MRTSANEARNNPYSEHRRSMSRRFVAASLLSSSIGVFLGVGPGSAAATAPSDTFSRELSVSSAQLSGGAWIAKCTKGTSLDICGTTGVKLTALQGSASASWSGIEAPYTGTFDLKIRYSNDWAQPLDGAVESGASDASEPTSTTAIEFPSVQRVGGRKTVGEVTSRVWLSAGRMNTIRLSPGPGGTAPEIVGVSISTPPLNGPGAGQAWLVSLGDSYISGEAGRWAGNTNKGESIHDAGGGSTYFDSAANDAEQIDRCHRSKSAEIHIGGGVQTLNLACSGAKTSTYTSTGTTSPGFKPGIDFYNSGGKQGQALMLQEFARSHNVKTVEISIGGNDFNFSGIVTQCVTDFLLSPSWAKDFCKNDNVVINEMTRESIAKHRRDISVAFQNVRQAMRTAGYADNSWTLLVSNYPSPAANSGAMRYPESGYTRHSVGGCGFWNADVDFANNVLLPNINRAVRDAATDSGLSNVKVLDLYHAFDGRRLCENTVGLYEEKGLASWKSPGAADQTEWVNTIRTATARGNYYIQESLHPNYWGQLALRNCVRQAFNDGNPRGGSCVRSSNGFNSSSEPNMVLH